MDSTTPNPPITPLTPLTPPTETPAETSASSPTAVLQVEIQEVQGQLRKLERRDWWLWGGAMAVMLLLTGAIVTLSFPELLKIDDPFFVFNMGQSVRALIGMVLLFNAYTVYQQYSITKLRRQFGQKLHEMGNLQMKAEEFYRQATTDPLTGLANRRTAAQRLSVETERSRRYGYPLTLIAFDLNNFKQINDHYGHAMGDQVLQEFSRRLMNAVRLSDLAVRMGGDEFLVVLPECRIEQVPGLLARLRPMEVNFQGHKVRVEFASGCVDYLNGETPDEFIERADQTLYADKRAGKSRREEETAAKSVQA